ncbi:hypothetical protein BGW80DRAFT_383933 [Lactifluus volemus]|nr:hypothetical protein BGW80DRAFT_383933 [Lactifluus volemus]
MKSLDCAYLSVGHFPLSLLSLIPTPPSRPHEYILLLSKTLEPNYPRLASQIYFILLDSFLTWTKMSITLTMHHTPLSVRAPCINEQPTARCYIQLGGAVIPIIWSGQPRLYYVPHKHGIKEARKIKTWRAANIVQENETCTGRQTLGDSEKEATA